MPHSYTKTTWTNNSGEALNAENLNNLETGAFKGNAHIGTAAPADTAREWYDTNTSPPTPKLYSGGSWVAVSGGGGGGSNLLVWDGSAYPDRPSGGGSCVFVGPMAPTDIDVANGDVWISYEPDPAATETVAGVAELATQAETNTGTDDARIVTPLKMRTVYSDASDPARGSALVGHDGETVRSAIIDVRQTVVSASRPLPKRRAQQRGRGRPRVRPRTKKWTI